MASPSPVPVAPPSEDPATDHDEEAVAVPSCSAWFSMDKVNALERRMLPEFFQEDPSASKTPELYVKYRNYMVHAYRQQPQVYLTATACRRNLAGDACAILRVHEFLTHWGIINFHVPPHNMPPSVQANYSLKAESEGRKESAVAVLVEAKKSSEAPLGCEVCGRKRDAAAFFELTAEAKAKFTNRAANGSAAAGTKELTIAGFALRPGSGICEDCYIKGAFPDGIDASDFVLMPTVESLGAAQWTKEETNALMEAVSSTRSNSVKTGLDDDELSGTCDWNFVASKVGTKTADECLLHFLEMPMLNQTGDSVGTAVQALQPFGAGEALNAPVLDLSSLVEQIDPLVAKAAARAAINAIKTLHTMPAVTQQDSNGEAVVETPAVKVEGAAGSEQSSLQGAVEAVEKSAETAGIAAAVKTEDASADDDVAMEDVSSSATATAPGDSAKTEEADGKTDDAPVSNELKAVTEEAANATTVALLATRAQQIADDTAKGPVRDLVNQLLENQVRQMELKMQQLNVLEQTIVAEKEQLAKEKYQLYVDRLAFAREKLNGRSGM